MPKTYETFVPNGSDVEHVTVTHPDIDGTADVPVDALEHYEAKGWKVASAAARAAAAPTATQTAGSGQRADKAE